MQIKVNNTLKRTISNEKHNLRIIEIKKKYQYLTNYEL